MVEKSFSSRSSFRSIIFMLLAFLAIPFPVLAQNNEITLSLGGIPSQSRSFQSPALGSTQISSDVSLGANYGHRVRDFLSSNANLNVALSSSTQHNVVASGGVSVRF
jgi:hypothetical protein